MGEDLQRFGRVTVDEAGIRKAAGWFTKGFDLRWAEIEGWSYVETGEGNPFRPRKQLLELHHRAGIATVNGRDAGGQFKALVTLVNRQLPKERRSVPTPGAIRSMNSN